MLPYGLVHTSVPMKQAMNIPDAKKAVDGEWGNISKRAWKLSSVKPKAEVIAEAKLKIIDVHFGTLMDLCHLKHSKLKKNNSATKAEWYFVAT